MATTSDNSSPPSTSSESIQSKEVQLHDNGVLAGTAVANPNGAWQLMLNNLTEGSHIMTASSGGTTSTQWAINVNATSGSDDWSALPEQTFQEHTLHFFPSGLIFFVMAARPTLPTLPCIKYIEQIKVLSLGNYATEKIIGFILPTNATRISITVVKTFQLDPSKGNITFIREDNFAIALKIDGRRGEQVFNIGTPIRYIQINYPQWGTQDEFNISNITWSNEQAATSASPYSEHKEDPE